MTLEQILAVYRGSSGDATRALYAALEAMPPRGAVAVKLLQACKASERAKTYSRRYRAQAYDKKDWAMAELCRQLVLQADDLAIAWGWARDPKAIGFEDVLYVDVPGAGQVSFHTQYRKDGPDYSGAWDGVRGAAPDRICRWAEAVLAGAELTKEEDHVDTTRSEGTPTEGVPREQGDEGEKQEAFDL